MARIIAYYTLLFVVAYHTSSSQNIETIYRDEKDSSRGVYIVIYPPKAPYKAFMFLIPGMFQTPQEVLNQTDLPRHAAQEGILTIIPTFKTGIGSIGVDTATQASFLDILDYSTTRHKLTGKPFFLGGFSIGGTCALKYAELAIANNFKIKPAAVFAVDSPLDFERMYRATERENRLPAAESLAQEEGNYMLKRFRKEFGGSPHEVLPTYYKLSPYSFSDTTQRAIKSLLHLPIRLYTEPDVLWWLNEGADYYGMNAFDFAAMTNELKRLGNTKVELITTQAKGIRKPDNKRHPHSWSIVDPTELVRWLLAQGRL